MKLEKATRIQHYEKVRKICQGGNCLLPDTVEDTFKIGDYKISKLQYLDDIYNNAYVEDNYHFLFDKEGTPYQICKTKSGNVRNYSDEIDRNQKLLDNITNALIFIDYSNKFPYALKYGKAGKDLEANIIEGLHTGDLSTINVKKYIDEEKANKMREKYISKLSKNELLSFIPVTSAKMYKTKDEMTTPTKSERTK